MKIANVWSVTSVILHKKETPKYLGSNVNSIPTAPCYFFVYYALHAACADSNSTKISSPGSFISGEKCPFTDYMCLGGWQRRSGYI